MARRTPIPKRKNPSALFAADLHVRATEPVARTDDYLAAQEHKLRYIRAKMDAFECPLFVAGDIGHKAQWPNWLLSMFIDVFKAPEPLVFVVPGQHDMPGHDIGKLDRAGLGVLERAGVIKIIGPDKNNTWCWEAFTVTGFSYGEELRCSYLREDGTKLVALTHQMVIKDKELWPGQVAPKAQKLLIDNPCFDLIVSGDNHRQFTAEYEGRKLLNPGSMMRMSADQADHTPAIWAWWADTNELDPIYLPAVQGVVSRSHIKEGPDADEKMEAFIASLKDGHEFGLHFDENLERYLAEHEVREPVKKIIREATTNG